MKAQIREAMSRLKASLLKKREHVEFEGRLYQRKRFSEKIEESFLAAAYAEAADMKDLLNVFAFGQEFVQPEECQYGDNEVCYRET